MTSSHASRNWLPDGRWHFQHGPIDLVIRAEGDAATVVHAHEDAFVRFQTVLQELVDELPALRSPVGQQCPVQGVVARRMWTACAPYREGFITAMAAVAGAVAEEILACYVRDGVDRAWVNNGGDIALHLAPGQGADVGVVADLAGTHRALLQQRATPLDGTMHIDSSMPVRGVATSGWRGRSLSLGIADSVTVLARTAAQADAAATVVANAVNVQDARITRMPAWLVRDDSDLGGMQVTVDVPPLPLAQVQSALQRGLHKAQALQSQGLLWFALLACQGHYAATPTARAAGAGAGALDAGARDAAAAAASAQVGSVFA
ncbi:UPF0280 family protein [Paracidovorax sp. MALMAid1276]|uniref:UPF0280 family protein n=1 Tax=Paracidovorax sp. MALMAid1276 TaxID=3411631 RepID=UPI003B9B4908